MSNANCQIHSVGLTAEPLLDKVAKLLCEYLHSLPDPSQPVVRLADPTKLHHLFDQVGVPLHISDDEVPISSEQLLEAAHATLKYSVRTGHPGFFNQLYARADPVATAADWLVSAANTNVHTYEAAPVFTAVEVEVLSKMARCIGGEYAHRHEGLFVSGGSLSNVYGMHLARNWKDPEYRTCGAYGGPPLVAFTSTEAHYSYTKAAFLTGLGSDNLVAVECNADGQMLPSALERALQDARSQGKVPFFVGATAGTTVLGAFDPFQELGSVCAQAGVWLHVDGAWGAACLLSPTHRHLMQGAEAADSLAWNPHKLMGLPLQCSAFLTRHPGLMLQSNSTNASYLFGKERLNAEYDIGDKTIQCGRRGDAYKLWLAWKAHGDAGWARIVDHSFHLAQAFQQQIQASNGEFVLVRPASYVNVCFWWIPPSLRPFNLAAASASDLECLGKVAPRIKGVMQEAGEAMINFQPLQGLPNFFRMVFSSAASLTADDTATLLTRIAKFGEKLFPAHGL